MTKAPAWYSGSVNDSWTLLREVLPFVTGGVGLLAFAVGLYIVLDWIGYADDKRYLSLLLLGVLCLFSGGAVLVNLAVTL